MKTAALLIAALIAILLMPAAITSIDSFRMMDQTDEYNVSTAENATSTTVTLSQELFGDETRNVSASSNLTTDAPIASSYTSASQVLTVTGLDDDADRLLTVEYKIDGLSDYWGAGTGARVWPIMLILGVIGIVTAGVYNATRRGD